MVYKTQKDVEEIAMTDTEQRVDTDDLYQSAEALGARGLGNTASFVCKQPQIGRASCRERV